MGHVILILSSPVYICIPIVLNSHPEWEMCSQCNRAAQAGKKSWCTSGPQGWSFRWLQKPTAQSQGVSQFGCSEFLRHSALCPAVLLCWEGLTAWTCVLQASLLVFDFSSWDSVWEPMEVEREEHCTLQTRRQIPRSIEWLRSISTKWV